MGRRRESAHGLAPAGKDDRPRIYMRMVDGGGFTFRVGLSGYDNGRYKSPGDALDDAMRLIHWKPAVIFWEGPLE